ncbi:hypothetical protein CAL7716_100230 (plasmid) [Calothrix sp. PCC 7716]|nr:hypothetical protein CAL7716_100230 [Calothrix sp. PCC 7716]
MKENHYCHAIGCERVVPPAYLMCRECWSKVPKSLQMKVCKYYIRGQEKSKTASPEYLNAANEAIESIKENH